MRVLVWNLFHGRAVPPAGRPLLREFADALAGWEWDVALLQEVPPWWPPLLARRCGAEWRSVLTSRNQLLPLRRAVASRAPDLLRSNGGGANAILVRAPWTITAHGRRRLRIRPERRAVQAVRVEARGTVDGGRGGSIRGEGAVVSAGVPVVWVGNVHTQLGHWDDAAGMAAPLADLARSVDQLEAWAGGSGAGTFGSGAVRPAIVLGGDLNLPRNAVVANLPDGWTRIASSGPDHVVGRGIAAAAPSSRQDRGPLSDHAPLLVDLAPR